MARWRFEQGARKLKEIVYGQGFLLAHFGCLLAVTDFEFGVFGPDDIGKLEKLDNFGAETADFGYQAVSVERDEFA